MGPFGPPGGWAGRGPRLVWALERELLELAARRADGALVFGMPVRWTRTARALLGPRRRLVVVQLCVLGPSLAEATATAAEAMPLRRGLLRELGHRDVATPDPEVVDALVAHGDVAAVAARVREQWAAGADHVALHVVTPGAGGVPDGAWAELAAALVP